MPQGILLERFMEEQRAAARIACPPNLVPAPGQYLLAHDPASDDPLAVPVFSAGFSSDGFLAAPPLPRTWNPGQTLSLRGPLGRGFPLPPSARRVALAALDENTASLLALLAPALAQAASVALVSDFPPDGLPDDVEIQPLASLMDVCAWADYLAVSVRREEGPKWREMLAMAAQTGSPREAQALVIASMPCGGLAECGVCALSVASESKWICKDGPVFNLFDLLRG